MKVKIYTTPEFDCMHFLFYEEMPDGKKYIAKPIELIMEEHKETDNIEPTLKLSSSQSKEFLQQMADEIRKQGIRNFQDELNEGELKASKYHLEDLRQLLKLK